MMLLFFGYKYIQDYYVTFILKIVKSVFLIKDRINIKYLSKITV